MNVQALAATRPATYRGAPDAPAHMAAELLGGALHLRPRPATRHALAASRRRVKLGGLADAAAVRPAPFGPLAFRSGALWPHAGADA